MGRHGGPGTPPQHAAHRPRLAGPPRRRPPSGDRSGALPPGLRPAPRSGEPGRDRPGPGHRRGVRRGDRPDGARPARVLPPGRGPPVALARRGAGPHPHARPPHRRPVDPPPGGGGVRRLRGAGGADLARPAGPGRARRPHPRQPARRRRRGERRAGPGRPRALDARVRHRGGVRIAECHLRGGGAVPDPAAVPGRLPLGDAARARRAGRPRGHDRGPGGHHVVHLALAGGRPPGERGLHPGLGRDLREPAAAVRGARPRGGHPAPRRAQDAAGHHRADRPPRRGVRHRPGRADVLRAAAPGQRQWSHPDRQQRRDVHRRLQQRPGRGAHARHGSAGRSPTRHGS